MNKILCIIFLLLHIYVISLLLLFFPDAFCPQFRGFFCHLSQFFGREMRVEHTEKFTYPYKGRIIFFFNFKYVFVLMPASLHRVEIGSWLACRKYSSIIPIRESGCWVFMSVSCIFCIIFCGSFSFHGGKIPFYGIFYLHAQFRLQT